MKVLIFLWLTEEPKKIMAGVYLGENPRLFLIEQLILFITMDQGPTETNYLYLYMFNY